MNLHLHHTKTGHLHTCMIMTISNASTVNTINRRDVFSVYFITVNQDSLLGQEEPAVHDERVSYVTVDCMCV